MMKGSMFMGITKRPGENEDHWAQDMSDEELTKWAKADDGFFGEEVFLAKEEIQRQQKVLDNTKKE